MYVGHAAIALALKARRPDVPTVPLVLAAYGPDWIDLSLMIPHPREGMGPYSHSVPAVVLGACIAALLFTAVSKREGAGVIAIAWLSHWLADIVTGRKPILGIAPVIGLDAYHVPPVDFVIETLVVTYACLEYGRRFVGTRQQRVLLGLLWFALVAAQGALNVVMSQLDGAPWNPSLAAGMWRPHVTALQLASGRPNTPHGSCTARLHSYGSERCRPRDLKGWSRWSA